MKRAKATEKEKEQIREWLDINLYKQLQECPFDNVQDCKLDEASYCQKFFPELVVDICPCTQYPIKYVRRVARELIKGV